MSLDPLTGRTLAEKYRIGERLAQGAMGSVYRAEHIGLGRPVAVKVINEFLLEHPQALDRFRLEARAASRIQHPNVVGILDFGTDGDLSFLVMEHVLGTPLDRELMDHGRLTPVRSAELVRQVLAGLSEAHGRGVVHRDLKPSNVVVQRLRDGREHAKVIDFGIAMLVEAGQRLTALGTVCGTPGYMAPEQILGEEALDARVDVYAAGVLLFELLVGQLPFQSDAPTKLALMHLSEIVPRPSRVAPDAGIHQVLDEIVLRAMAKPRDERFSSAAEMHLALEAYLRLAVDAAEIEHCRSCGASVLCGTAACPICGHAPTVSTRAASDVISQSLGVSPAAFAAAVAEVRPPEDRPQGTLSRLPAAAAPSGDSLFGRASELAEVCRALSIPGACVRIRGEPGSGRRTLAAAALARASRELGLRAAAMEAEAGPCRPLAGARALAGALGVGATGGARELSARLAEAGRRDGVLSVAHPERLDRESAGVLGELLAATTRRLRILVIESSTSHSGPSGEQVLLGPLAAEPTRALWELHAGRGDVPPWLRDGGTPLAIVLAALLRDELPVELEPTVQQIVDAALGNLPPAVAGLISLVAVAGERVPRKLFDRAATGEMRSVLGRAVALGLLVIERDHLAFLHAAAREAVLVATPAGARALHHAAVLEALPAEATAALRAYHARGAEQPEMAALLEEAAGDEALSASEPAAIECWSRALELLRVADPTDPEAAGTRSRVARKLAEALDRRGEATLAEAVLREALQALGAAGAAGATLAATMLEDALRSGRWVLAADLLERTLRATADLPSVAARVVGGLEAVGRDDRALSLIAVLRRTRALDPLPPAFDLAAARAQLRDRRPVDAERCAMAAAGAASGDRRLQLEAYRVAAEAAASRRAPARAAELLEHALDCAVATNQTGHMGALLEQLSELHHSLGDPLRAERFRQAARSLGPQGSES